MQVCISLQTENHASTPPLSSYRGVSPGEEKEKEGYGG